MTNDEYIENPWLFKNEPFLEIGQYKKYEGFVYLLIDKVNQNRYIGRKYFYQLRKKSKSSRRVRTESDWKEYCSSSSKIKNLVVNDGINRFERHILCLCLTRGDANYMEKKYQFIFNVLEDDNWYNDCIGSQRVISKRILDSRIESDLVKTLES